MHVVSACLAVVWPSFYGVGPLRWHGIAGSMSGSDTIILPLFPVAGQAGQGDGPGDTCVRVRAYGRRGGVCGRLPSSSARFFCPKAAKRERSSGLDRKRERETR